MYTSLLVCAVMGTGAAAVTSSETLTWQESYTAALSAARKTGKPLAVIVGTGKAGFDKLAAEGKLSETARRSLAADYVALYLNLDKPADRTLAAKFDIPSGVGLVVSDKALTSQALHHTGTMDNSQIESVLTRMSTEPVAATTTVVTGASSVSTRSAYSYVPSATPTYAQPSYAQPSYAQPSYAQPSYAQPSYAPSYGGFGGGYSGGFGGYSGGSGFGGGSANC